VGAGKGVWKGGGEGKGRGGGGGVKGVREGGGERKETGGVGVEGVGWERDGSRRGEDQWGGIGKELRKSKKLLQNAAVNRGGCFDHERV